MANGYSEHFVQYVRKVRSTFPKQTIIAGNVVTGEMVEELILSGADIIKGKTKGSTQCYLEGFTKKLFFDNFDFFKLKF